MAMNVTRDPSREIDSLARSPMRRTGPTIRHRINRNRHAPIHGRAIQPLNPEHAGQEVRPARTEQTRAAEGVTYRRERRFSEAVETRAQDAGCQSDAFIDESTSALIAARMPTDRWGHASMSRARWTSRWRSHPLLRGAAIASFVAGRGAGRSMGRGRGRGNAGLRSPTSSPKGLLWGAEAGAAAEGCGFFGVNHPESSVVGTGMAILPCDTGPSVSVSSAARVSDSSSNASGQLSATRVEPSAATTLHGGFVAVFLATAVLLAAASLVPASAGFGAASRPKSRFRSSLSGIAATGLPLH